jgi:hypothetical protein
MPTYKKPLNLESLQSYLDGRGFKRSLLTVSSGTEQIEFPDVVIDQAGNVRARSDSEKAANLAMQLTETIQMFRNG